MTDPALSLDPALLLDALAKQSDTSGRLRLEPETIEQDLGRLVLGLAEFLRQVLESQAIRRMENGQLTADEEERLGTALMRAESAIHDLAAQFGLSPEDLSLDLGPLGRTI